MTFLLSFIHFFSFLRHLKPKWKWVLNQSMVDVQSWGQNFVLTIRTTPGYLELQEEIVNISQTWRKLCQTIFIIVLKQRWPLIDLVSVSVKSSGAAVTICQINSHDKPCRQLACMHVYRMYSTLAHRNTGNFLFKMIYLQHVFMLGFVF